MAIPADGVTKCRLYVEVEAKKTGRNMKSIQVGKICVAQFDQAGQPWVPCLFLREEIADQPAFGFVFNTREEFRPQALNCFRSVERHLCVDLAAAEMARLAAGFEDGFDLRWEVYFGGGACSAGC